MSLGVPLGSFPLGSSGPASLGPSTPSPQSPQGNPGAIFENNTIINAVPETFDESPVIGSPADVSYLWTAYPERIRFNSFLYAEGVTGHAINLTRSIAADFVGNTFNGKWLDGTSPDGNGTPDAALFNGVGQVILKILSGGSLPTFLDKQSPGTTLLRRVTVTITNLQPETEIRVYPAEGSNSPIDINEIAGVGDTGSPAEFVFQAAPGLVVDIVIHNIEYVLPPDNRIRNFTVPNNDTSFPVTQIVDRSYSNP